MRKTILAMALSLSVCGAIPVVAQNSGSTKDPPTKGTPQLPGDNGKIGQAYTMGTGNACLNFVLLSSSYTVNRLLIETQNIVPKTTDKLLILNFTVQNPNKTPTYFNNNTLDFVAVDSKSVNHRWAPTVAKIDDLKHQLSVPLQPGQKVAVVCAIPVPSDAVVPKLIVKKGPGDKVLRYDLTDKIKPLQPPFADPADAAGNTALATVNGSKDLWFPTQSFDLQFASAQLVDGPVGDKKPPAGKRFLVVTMNIKNAIGVTCGCNWNTFKVSVIGSDGEKERGELIMFKGSRNELFSDNIEVGDTRVARFIYPVSADVKPKSFIIGSEYYRMCAFPLADL